MNRKMVEIQGSDLEAPSVFKRKGTVTEIAALIGYLLGDESTFTTGAAYTMDGGWVC
jgi:NAD(P)-dependent dehydrogenase (short-subunit alcohol dehydrogenase family)